jgi:hypothetical protein
MMTPARIQDTDEAPPATLDALSAPSNQPDPMIDPSDVNINANTPASRRKLRCPDDAAT